MKNAPNTINLIQITESKANLSSKKKKQSALEKLNLSFKIENYGCQMNIADANEIASLLEENGYKQEISKGFNQIPDIVIFNSCAIRETSENRIYRKLEEYSHHKKKKNFVLILMGCVAQKEGDRILEKLPYVDLIIGTHEKYRLPEILENYFKNEKVEFYSSGSSKNILKSKALVYDELGNYEFTPSVVNPKSPFRGDIIIIHGCDKYCAYCIVPYTRGKEMSQKSDDIIQTAKKLVAQGVSEITLLGQNVNSYGKDTGDLSFAQLLYALNEKVSGLKRIRFLTSHPMDFSQELIQAIADCDKVCKYVHLPIQSASNFVLKKMKREYTYEHYLTIIDSLRSSIKKKLVLSTDLLVGFPYESEKDFLMTYDALDRLSYDTAYMFKYSVRRGSESAQYEDSVPEEEKKRRLQAIIQKQRQITHAKNLEDLNSIEEVLVENPSRNHSDEFIGKTEGNKPVVLKGDKSLIGKYFQVQLKELKGNTFKGVILK